MKNVRRKYFAVALLSAAAVLVAAALILPAGARTLNVNDVGSDPAAYTGTITITGIMAGVSRLDPTVIGLMDLKELQCSNPDCHKIYVPVKVQGPQPVPGDEVRVTGSFAPTQHGYVFMAEKIKVVRNHRTGG